MVDDERTATAPLARSGATAVRRLVSISPGSGNARISSRRLAQAARNSSASSYGKASNRARRSGLCEMNAV
jgi:hypothetical protein